MAKTSLRIAMFRGLVEKRKLHLERMLEENASWASQKEACRDLRYRIAALNEMIMLLSSFETSIED